MLKKSVSILLALVIMCTLFSCMGPSAPDDSQKPMSGEGKLFSQPTELSIVISSHQSWPYNPDWKMWQYFREATGATLNVTTIPATETDTKVTLMMADKKSLPDLLHLWDMQTVNKHASSGAFVALSDNLDKLPNYIDFWDAIPEVERDEIMAQRTAADGKIYSAPSYGTHTISNMRSWIYRKDIFEKHNLKVPETFEELYQTAKKLKEIYPESYPLCLRNVLMQMGVTAPSWQNDMALYEYYDFKENEWRYGAKEPVMRDMMEYFIKLHREGLIPPDCLTIKTKSWEELITTDRGFISIEYIVRLDYFNIPSRKQNPDFTFAAMRPPVPDSPSAQSRLMKGNWDFYGYLVCNTGKTENINNAIKLIDWMYTDEAEELLSWGKEGETYEVVDGSRRFILGSETDTPRMRYGMGSYGLYQRMDVDAYEAGYTKEQVEACRMTLNYLEDHINPVVWLPLNDEESDVVDNLRPEIQSYVDENLSKFLLGQQSMSEWDKFQQGLSEMDVERLLGAYDSAYTRLMSINP